MVAAGSRAPGRAQHGTHRALYIPEAPGPATSAIRRETKETKMREGNGVEGTQKGPRNSSSQPQVAPSLPPRRVFGSVWTYFQLSQVKDVPGI